MLQRNHWEHPLHFADRGFHLQQVGGRDVGAQRVLRAHLTAQIDRTIAKVTLEAAIADQRFAELEQEHTAAAESQAAAVTKFNADLAACDKQVDLLLDMRLSEQIGESEYVSKKHTLINRKAEIRGKLEAFETNRLNRFEPAIRFVLEAKHGAKLLAEGNPEHKWDFLKKNGSNFFVAGQALTVTFLTHWQLVADFNSVLTSPHALQRENCENQNWRRGWDSNPR